jgi:16S rRNA (cytosine1402-N4)-methyltransferase
MNITEFHKPVMLNEVLSYLLPKDNEIYLDGTFGAGGYSKAILNLAKCSVIAIDRDDSVKKFASLLSAEFGNKFIFENNKFSNYGEVLSKNNISKVDGMIFDIGVSSMQLDEKERGFSFDSDTKLDMRMDKNQSLSAFEVINNLSEIELAKIIKDYGDEPKARAIAKKIIYTRAKNQINSCKELANIVRSFYKGYFKTDPATKTFQAVRIYVNQELDELKKALDASINFLKKDGRLIVVSFHSLEDKIVKNFLKDNSGIALSVSRYEPEIDKKNIKKNFLIKTRSAISPSENEIIQNPRARSAKMRVAIKI